MLTVLLLGITVATLVATYAFWIRPVLSTKPSFAHYYEHENSFWAAINAKVGGLKQKLTTAIVGIAAFVVSMYDFLAPLVAQQGLDVTKLTDKVPSQYWPLIGFMLIALVQYFRNLSDKRVAAVLETKGIDPATVLAVPPKVP